MKTILISFFILFSFLSLAQINDSNVNLLINKIYQTEEKGDNNSNDYANLINNLAIYYINKEMYIEAEPLFFKVSKIRKNVYGENHLSYATSLNNLAFIYKELGRFNDAENNYLNALKIYKDNLGERNKQYALFLDNLACLYFEQAKYSDAKQIFSRVLSIRKEVIGENDKDYCATLNKLATINQFEGNYSEAELLFVKLADINLQIFGENSIEYAISIGNIGSLYNLQFKYNESEILLLKALEITKNIFGKTHPYYGTTLSNLALLYQNQDKFSIVEPLLKECFEITKNSFGENNSKHVSSINNLANLYLLQRKFIKAEILYLKALETTKNILGETHPDYAFSLDGLARIYEEQGKFSKAETCLLKITEINKNIFGVNNANYATSLNNLAGIYQQQNIFKEAELLYIKASNIFFKLYGEKNLFYATSLSNLGLSNYYLNNYSQAETYFVKSLEINKQILGNSSWNYITILHHLAILYREIGNIEKSSICFNQFILLNQDKTLDDIYTLSEDELITHINFKKINLFSPLSFLNNFSYQYPILVNSCFNNILLIKNLTVRNRNQIKNVIQKSNNLLLKDKYEQFVTNKRMLTKLSELSIDNVPLSFSKLKDETEQIEKELVKESTTFSNFKNSISINFNQIKDKLKKNEISIDIVSYNYYDKSVTDSTFYSAFVVGKDFKFTKFIKLFEKKQLDNLFDRNKNQPNNTLIDKQYLEEQISELILNPLEEELKGVSTIYLSLSGLTHQINFTALPIGNNQTFGQKFKIHILNSPGELIEYNSTAFDKKGKLDFILYGGIDYDKKTTSKEEIDIVSDITSFDEEIKDMQTRSSISSFGYLSGTKNEIQSIKILATDYNFKATIFDDRNAKEESIKQLDGRTSPFVLHIATHGFFFPDPIKESPNENMLIEGKSKIFKASDDPMMRSGLVFSGANKSWGKPNENQSGEDGILTASEISNLDLSACQLVVLSACETGLGEVKGSDGVFGLQRAFKMAGVKNIIMSLWKVPDTQTAELFDIFYSECFAGKTIHEAFQSAQSQMKAKYSPYYWAGFVLLE